MHVHDDGAGPLPEEVEEVLAVHLDAAEHLLVDGLCACKARVHCQLSYAACTQVHGALAWAPCGMPAVGMCNNLQHACMHAHKQRTVRKAPVGRHCLEALVQERLSMGMANSVALVPLHHPDGQVGEGQALMMPAEQSVEAQHYDLQL